MRKMIKKYVSATFLLVSLSGIAFADSQLATNNPHFGEKGWDVEVAAAVGRHSGRVYVSEDDEDNFFSLGINATYYGDSVYFIADDNEGLLLGYSLIKQQSSVVDLILAPRFGGFSTDNDALKDLDKRDTDLHAGLRYTQYLGDSVYKVELSKDVSGAHGGSILSARYEKEWQQKNWVITGGVTASYITEKMTDYYFGVSDQEANTQFAAYKADASALFEVSIQAEYPINEHWVATAAVHHFISDGKLADSPITDEADELTIVVSSIKYHF